MTSRRGWILADGTRLNLPRVTLLAAIALIAVFVTVFGSRVGMAPTKSAGAATATAPTYTVPSSYQGVALPDNCSTDVTIPLWTWLNSLPQPGPGVVQFPSNGCYLINHSLDLRNWQNYTFDGNGTTLEQTNVSAMAYQYTDTADQSQCQPAGTPNTIAGEGVWGPCDPVPNSTAGRGTVYCGSSQLFGMSGSITTDHSTGNMLNLEGGCDLTFRNFNLQGSNTHGVSRSVTDAVLNGTATLTSASAHFSSADVGDAVSGNTNIPANTVILSILNTTTVTLTNAATGGTLTSQPVTFSGGSRSVTGAVLNGTATLMSASANFSSADVGDAVSGNANIPANTTVLSVVNATTVTLSSAATGGTLTGQSVTFSYVDSDTATNPLQDVLVQFNGAQRVSFTNNTLSNPWGDWVSLFTVHEPMYLDSMGNFPSTDITIQNNNFEGYAGRMGISVVFGNRVDISNNAFGTVGEDMFDLEWDATMPQNCECNINIHNNTINGGFDYLIAAVTGASVDSVAFTNNQITSAGTDPQGNRWGDHTISTLITPYAGASVSNLTINNNSVAKALASAIQLGDPGFKARSVTDAVLNGTSTLSSTSANFSSADVGDAVSGNADIPANTTVLSVVNATTVTLSNAATGGTATNPLTGQSMTFTSDHSGPIDSVDIEGNNGPFSTTGSYVVNFGGITTNLNVRNNTLTGTLPSGGVLSGTGTTCGNVVGGSPYDSACKGQFTPPTQPQAPTSPAVYPTTNVIVPSRHAFVSGTQGIAASASPSSVLTSVNFQVMQLNGSRVGTPLTGAPFGSVWVVSWNTTQVADGTYNLQSVSCTASGCSASPNLPVTVCNHPPCTSIVLPANDTAVSGMQNWDALATDTSGVTISSVHFHLTGGPLNLNNVDTGPATLTLYGWVLSNANTHWLPNGIYQVTSVVTDSKGNTATSTPVAIFVAN